VKVFVTGGTGFVGAALVRALLERRHELSCLVRTNSDRSNLDGLDLRLVEGDLRDPGSLEAGMRGCDAVFHVAADYRLWAPRPEELYAINVEGSRNVVSVAAKCGVGRTVYTSSVATLGSNSNATPADERTPSRLKDMIGHYKRSKYLAEQAVRELIVADDLPVVIVNPSTPVGPRDIKPTPTGRMIRDAAQGMIPAYVDTGLNIVHVDDVAKGHILAWERGTPGERYILGGHNMSLREILTYIAKLTGRNPPRIRLPHGVVLPLAHASEWWARLRGGPEPRATVDGVRMARKRMYFSSAKAVETLGYRYRPAQRALEDAVSWFLEQRDG